MESQNDATKDFVIYFRVSDFGLWRCRSNRKNKFFFFFRGKLPCEDGSHFQLSDRITVTIDTAVLHDTDSGNPGRVGNQLRLQTKPSLNTIS